MDTSKNYPFVFTGKGSEYFRIWIVNIALTIVTLGIYSAWAKVRTNRWFYGHTLLDNTSFSYLATPSQILKGRLIAMAILLALVLGKYMFPLFDVLIILGLSIASPWIIVMALRFAARQSAYRGLRFNFTGTIIEAVEIYLFLPILSSITLGLAFPYMMYRQVNFLASNYAYGGTQTRYEIGSKPFFVLYFKAFLLYLIPLVCFFVFMDGIRESSLSQTPEEFANNAKLGLLIWGGILPFYLSIPLITAFIKARTVNLFYNHMSLGDVHFSSTQRARDLAWIYFVHLVLIALTFGLFIPFAKVRLARYKAEHLSVIADDLSAFTAQAIDKTSATGGEISEIFDMDIGIG